MNLTETEIFWDLVSRLGMSLRIAIAGWCFYRLLDGLLLKRYMAAGIGIFYAGLLLLLYWIPVNLDGYFVYESVMACSALLACCMAARMQRRFIIFLCITFSALREIAVNVAGTVYGQLYNAVLLPPASPGDPAMQSALFAVCVSVYTGLTALLLLLAVAAIQRAYPRSRTQLTWREFWLLSLPSIAAAIATEVLAQLRYPLTMPEEYAAASLMASTVLAVLFAAILGTIVLFAQITREQDRRRAQEALTVQMADMHQYVGDLEALYTRLRGYRHDLANQLETLQGLRAAGNTPAAAAYAESSCARLDEILPAVRSGNAVTDIILSSLQLKAQEEGTAFESTFHFPDAALDPFDMGVILHNAGTNALRAADGIPGPFVRIRSWQHRQAFMIECTNSCTSDFMLAPSSSLPPSSKEDGEDHGFGLANIRSVASRYGGRCEMEAAGGICTLTVMLMLS